MTWTIVPTLAVVILLSALGKEAKGIRLGSGSATAPSGAASGTVRS
ncbi:hypothetical protein RFN58_05255 [Streptomyces iakyrus]|nr:hypothetical protein [Streptomyces iakyrus]